MLVEKGQKYTRKHRTYTVTHVDEQSMFMYITVLEDGYIDNKANNKIFGITAFESEFKFIKEVKDG